jgi:flagellar motor switch protein FliN/FliY
MSDQGVDGGDAPFASAQNLKLLESVEVKLIVEVGGTKISIRDLLKLSEGSVVELERLAGELLDISVNGTLIAKGEIVAENGRFGLRIVELAGGNSAQAESA